MCPAMDLHHRDKIKATSDYNFVPAIYLQSKYSIFTVLLFFFYASYFSENIYLQDTFTSCE